MVRAVVRLSSFVCRLSVVCLTYVLWLNDRLHHKGSAMAPLGRALVSSYRLSMVTISLSAAVWPQFATQVFGVGRCRKFMLYRKLCKQATKYVHIC